jgi:hypothetical protein
MVREIHLDEGCRMRFPGRSMDFRDGVEIGILAALMDTRAPKIARWIAAENVDQAQALAERLGYRVTVRDGEDGWSHLTLEHGARRPVLRLVASRD